MQQNLKDIFILVRLYIKKLEKFLSEIEISENQRNVYLLCGTRYTPKTSQQKMFRLLFALILCLFTCFQAQFASDCFGEPDAQIQFHLFTDISITSGAPNEGEADLFCQDFSDGSRLASIRNFKETELVLNLLLVTANSSRSAWIGLFDDGTSGLDGSNPERFKFIDGFDNNTFFATQGVDPWRNGRPTTNEEMCVMLEGQFWNDVRCSASLNVICRSPCNELILEPEVEMNNDDGSELLVGAGLVAFGCFVSLIISILLIYNKNQQIQILKQLQLNLEDEALSSMNF